MLYPGLKCYNNNNFCQVLNRPSSAPTSKLHLNQQRGPGMKSKTKTIERDEQKPLTDKEKEERDKVIDNLLERTKTLLGEKEVCKLFAVYSNFWSDIYIIE